MSGKSGALLDDHGTSLLPLQISLISSCRRRDAGHGTQDLGADAVAAGGGVDGVVIDIAVIPEVANFDMQLHVRESITTIESMDFGQPLRSVRNDKSR
jgi:hypothetical protein